MPGFFDKVKAVAGEKAMEAQVRSKEALESQQVKGKINEFQSQRIKALASLGTTVYGMYESSNWDPDALTPDCQAIAAIDVQLKEKEAELEEIHRRAEAALGIKPEPAPAPAAQPYEAPAPAPRATATCPECSGAYEGSPKFCPNCGYRFS